MTLTIPGHETDDDGVPSYLTYLNQRSIYFVKDNIILTGNPEMLAK